MKRILIPVALPVTAPSLVQQAAFLARHYDSEIILLHVVSPWGYPAGALEKGHELTERDLQAELIKRAQQELDEALQSELSGIPVRRLLLRGNPAHEIVRVARDEGASLIAMSTHCHDPLYRLLLGSVTAKVLHHSDCPMWTHSRLQAVPASEFSIRNVLCAVDLSPHSHDTAVRAAQIAADFGARLTLVHVTAAVEIYGPGGVEVLTQLKDELVGFATQQMTKLEQDIGTDAEVIIESGAVLGSLARAVERAQSDLLVIGHLPAGGHLGANGAGYAIIRDSRIPVLSV